MLRKAQQLLDAAGAFLDMQIACGVKLLRKLFSY